MRKRREKGASRSPVTNRAVESVSPNARPTQLASEAQIVSSDGEDVTAIVEFLESFRQLADPRTAKAPKLISIKVPEPLLAAFRFKAERENKKYQTKIKELMLEYVRSGSML